MFPFQADNHQAHNAPLLPQTCLSAAPHDDRVSDVTLHYFGCLRRSQRRRFFESLSPAEQQRLARERHKVERRRAQVEQLLLEEAGLFSPQYPAGAKPPPMDTSNAASKLRDFKEHMAEYRRVKGWPSAEQRARHYDGAMEGLAVRADEGVDADIKAPVVFFRDGAGCDVPGLPGSFPNQKVTIAELLGGPSEEARRHGGGNNGVNPLTMPIDDNVVRYIHLPANNMAWVEEAVARYYGERRPTADEMLFNSRRSAGLSARTRTERLLRHEFWRGQQGFDAHSEVHARHMRPMCSPVSIDPVTKEVLPRNLVLFMPYLHWETDRGRMVSAESIKEVNRDKFRLASVADVVNKASHNKDGSGNGGAHNNGQSMQAVGHRDFPHTRVLATSTTTTFGGTASSAPSGPHAPAKLYADKAERRRLLGSVLRTAAVLLEALEFRTEARLIGTYLHGDAPLHPRRTLDQSYYGALKNTGTRDRDQVVYRATTPQPHDCYEHLDERTGKCRQCLEDIKKVPRLIMVDQLWLWILDESEYLPRLMSCLLTSRGTPCRSYRL